MKSWIFAASSAVFVAGCGAGVVEGNYVSVANTADNSAGEAAASNASATTPAANVAIGRWV